MSKFASEVLEQPCILSMMAEQPDFLIPYGKEPCFSLRQVSDGHKQDERKNFRCPYYDICPATENSRKIASASVVVTNIHAFCLSSFGKERKLFMNYAIRNFDLVIIDEIDNVLCTMDSIFAPSVGVNDYLTSVNNFRIAYQTSSLKEKNDFGEEKFKCYELISRFELLLSQLNKDIRGDDNGWAESNLKHFSAMSLLYKLKKSDENTKGLPDDIWKLLYRMLGPLKEDKEIELLRMIENREYSETYLKSKFAEICLGSPKALLPEEWTLITRTQWKKLWFLLVVIEFEQIYRELSSAVADLPDAPLELQKILNQSLYKQQRIMPAAPVGNTFSIEVREDDVYLSKQFAIGRALALCMDRLSIDCNGHGDGASVLMMSGTGYMPGSDRFHVSDRVDYIIEAQQEKRDYIAKAEIYDCAGHGSNRICVSGSPEKNKNRNLRNLIKMQAKILEDRVTDGDNILVIVNSYDQCHVAYEEIKGIMSSLKKKPLKKEENGKFMEADYAVQYLTPGTFEGDNADGSMTRKQITKFEKGIMIAPACIIERGHNIVDPLGNARLDTVMYYVRPLSNPESYDLQVQKVNGYIMSDFYKRHVPDRISVAMELRRKAYEKYAQLHQTKGSLKDLPFEMQRDVIASFFVTFDQIFGRLCRLGFPIKEKPIKIYLMDGAFHADSSDGFDMVYELEQYLEQIMKGKNPIVAKTLYEPFYLALKGRK